MNSTWKRVLWALAAAALLAVALNYLGFHNRFGAANGTGTVTVTGIFPADMKIAVHYSRLGGDEATEKATRRSKFSTNQVLFATAADSDEEQTVVIPLTDVEFIGGLKLTFGADTFKREGMSKEQLKALQFRFGLSAIEVSLADTHMQWRLSQIKEGWQQKGKIRLQAEKGGIIPVVAFPMRAALELKEPLNQVASRPDENNNALAWINLIPALLLGALVWWLLGRAKSSGAHEATVLLPLVYIMFSFSAHTDGSFTKSREYGNIENRRLATMPAFDSENWLKWTADFDDYYRDNFGLRQPLTELLCRFKFYALGVSPFPDQVIVGKDGWLYKAEVLPDFNGAALHTDEELEFIAAKFQAIHEACEAVGTDYYLCLSPDKFEVYPEFLPPSMRDYAGTRMAEQVAAYLRQHTDVKVITMSEAFAEQKEQHQLFYKTDLHWNDRGGYLAYSELCSHLGLADTLAALDSTMRWKPMQFGRGGLSAMIYLQQDMDEPSERYKQRGAITVANASAEGLPAQCAVKTNGTDDGPVAVVFRDSFFRVLVPLFSRHFSKSVYIKNAQRTEALNLDSFMLSAVKPDVLIHQSAQFSSRSLLEY